MNTKCLAGVLLFFFCGLTFAGQQTQTTGKVLLEKMNSRAKADKDYVLGYTQAVYASYLNKTTLADEREIKPVIDAAKKYLQRNPQKLDQPANVLLRESFEENALLKKK
jgi:hypothetical protein